MDANYEHWIGTGPDGLLSDALIEQPVEDAADYFTPGTRDLHMSGVYRLERVDEGPICLPPRFGPR